MPREAVRPVPRPTIHPDWISATAAAPRASAVCDWLLKADPLCQIEPAAVVDRAGLATHVRLPRIAPRFAAASSFLLTTERTADLRPARARVDVGDPAVAAGPR